MLLQRKTFNNAGARRCIMHSRSVMRASWLLLALASPRMAAAQKPDTAQLARARSGAAGVEWTADDLLLYQDAHSFRVSPDGNSVAWIQTAMSTVTGRVVSNMYLAPSKGGTPIQLTRGNYTVSDLAWSPDGKRIAFQSTRPLPEGSSAPHAASTQLWLIDLRGGDAWPVTKLEKGVDDFVWKDRDTVIFSAAEETPYDRLNRERKDDSRVVDDSVNKSPVRLYSLAVETQQIHRLTENTDWIDSFALSPDGVNVVTVNQRSVSFGYDQKIPPVTRLTNLTTGTSRLIFDGVKTIPYSATWASDGAGFYFSNDSTTSPRYRTATIGELDYYDLATGKTIPVDRTWTRGVAGNFRATPDGLVVNLNNGVVVEPVRYTRRRGENSWTRESLRGAHADHSFDIDISRDAHTIAYRYTRANVPPQLFGATLTGARIGADVQITDLNPSFKTKPQPKTETVRWKGARDEEVEGILTYPLDYKAGTRYPLILTIHGGPALADLDEWKQIWSYPRILLNQKGAFTLQVNYHGSARYGLHWVESICCGNLYDLETPDLERGIAYVVDRGLADTARLGTLGHSYGAILSTHLTTIDQRFKAASVAAGDVEWFSDWGGVHFGASYDNYYFGASPWENPELYIKKSPVFRFQNVRTPTIIYQGTDDTQVPPGEGWTNFRTLQQLGNVPVRFIIFPDEGHNPSKYVHQRRKVDEDMAWFDRYLFGKTDTTHDTH
jgi:dipeptidyl aminopeptidase/acylaminoacyl peptidase